MKNTRRNIPSTNSLIGFEAVCRYMNFTRASDELCVTQAAVSRQIMTLEKYLGVKLFDRRAHGVFLTQDGERFADSVIPAVGSIKKAVDTILPVTPSGFARSGQFNVYAEGCISASWLIPNVYRFQDEHPQTKIRILDSISSLDAQACQIDVGLQYGPISQGGFLLKGIWKDDVIVVCSPGYARNLPQKLSVRDIPQFPLIHLDENHSIFMPWSKFFRKFDIDTSIGEVSLSFENFHNALEAACLGKGLLLGKRFIVERSIQEGKLVQVENFSTPLKEELHLYIHSSKYNSSEMLDFVNWMRAEISSIL
jgi:LysR family glycine cleavage system transcriptional activator